MDKERSQRFMQKVVGDVGTALAAALVGVGDTAGLFRAMAGAGSLSAGEIADRSAVHPRCVEEWLATMVCAGYVEYDADADRYVLPDEHALFFADPASEYYLGGLFAGVPALAAMAPRLAAAFESGSGVAFAEFGAQMPVALEQMNRAVYENRLVRSWLPAIPEALRRLEAGGSAIDVGCGTGIVPITLARAFPRARVAGLDFDARSIEIARSHAREAGVADRVRFIHASASDLPAEPRYDLITSFDAIHDLPDPGGALERIRAALADGGSYLMVEPRVDDSLEANRDSPFARMLYSISCLHCVPQALAQGGPALGACWGPARARELARQAGFSYFEPLPIRSPAMSFYELRR